MTASQEKITELGPYHHSEESGRYGALIAYKCAPDGYNGVYTTYYQTGEYEHLPRKQDLCSSCDAEKKSKIEYIQLHLTPDSANADLDEYVAQLPDLSDYPEPTNIHEGFFELGDGCYYGLLDDILIAFAEENTILEKNEQALLDDLLNNIIKDKGRRYPNEEELTQWLKRYT
jgi:hypothetical protein